MRRLAKSAAITILLFSFSLAQRFTEVASELGVKERGPRNTWSVTWGDYDNDGDLDLYLVNAYFESVLFRNDLDESGQFTNVATELGVADTAKARSANWIDYYNDGDLDMFITNRARVNKQC